ncbi:NAD(P)-dependent oxidoreductase [Streptomyces sp. NPDC051677]|uniref:NAD(P)-dependent oxidoreductase n=1 Tax=Streptomyces sp. NPDC051677 TaxID=3365669 RepID=UPI0037D376E6
MTIAVLGATGTVGSRVITEARARGHRVLALSRKPASADPGVTPVAVDARDPRAVHEALSRLAARAGEKGDDGEKGDAGEKGEAVEKRDAVEKGEAVDAVVLTVRTEPVDQEFLVDATRTVLDSAAQLGARLLVVGGAGALRSSDDTDLLVADNPAYVPAELKAVAAAGIAQLRACQAHADADADWVFLSPPALLEPGERTGRYLRGTDTLLTAADGRSWISAEDLAVAVLDELETPVPGPDRHITVVHASPGSPRPRTPSTSAATR